MQEGAKTGLENSRSGMSRETNSSDLWIHLNVELSTFGYQEMGTKFFAWVRDPFEPGLHGQVRMWVE